MHMDVEGDADKAIANLKRHGKRFEEAVTSLLDPQALAQEDAASEGEALGPNRHERKCSLTDCCLHLALWGQDSTHLRAQSYT
jgi:uncharacterized DUF497 family protein